MILLSQKNAFKLTITALELKNMSFSCDNSSLAFCSEESLVYVWNFARGDNVIVFEGHEDSVNQVCFSTDGSLIGSASCDNTVKIWNLKFKEEELKAEIQGRKEPAAKAWKIQSCNITNIGDSKFTLRGHSKSVNCLCFIENGGKIISGSDDFTVKVWDLVSGTEILNFSGHNSEIICLYFYENDSILVAGLKNGSAIVWSTRNSSEKFEIKVSDEPILELMLFSENKHILAQSKSSAFYSIDLNTKSSLKICEQSSPVIIPRINKDSKPLTVSISTEKGTAYFKKIEAHYSSTLTISSGLANSLCITKDGNSIITVSPIGSIELWDSKTQQKLVELASNLDSSSIICFRSGENYLVSINPEKITLWNWKTKECQEYEGSGTPLHILSSCFSPDGEFLASGFSEGLLKVWNFESRKLIFSSIEHTQDINSVCFSPSGKLLASGSNDKTIKVWDFKANVKVFQIYHQLYAFITVAFSPNEKLIVGATDKDIRFWNASTQEKQKGKKLRVRASWFCISPNGSHLVCNGEEGELFIFWHINTKTRSSLVGHSEQVRCVDFSSDGKLIASGSRDKLIFIWDSVTNKQLSKFEGHSDTILSVKFAPQGKFLASGSRDHSFRIWDLELKQTIFESAGFSASVLSLCFSPDGNFLVTSYFNEVNAIWNFYERKKIYEFPNSSLISSVSVSPDEEYIAFGDSVGIISIWTKFTQKNSFTLEKHKKRVTSICFSPNNQLLASASYDKEVMIWNYKTKNAPFVYKVADGTPNALCFSPSGDCLAIGRKKYEVIIIDVKTKKVTYLSCKGINCLCFSLDGAFLLGGSDDKLIKCWSVNNKELLFEEKKHNGSINSIAISPDGQYIISGSEDKTVQITWFNKNLEYLTCDGSSNEISSSSEIKLTNEFDSKISNIQDLKEVNFSLCKPDANTNLNIEEAKINFENMKNQYTLAIQQPENTFDKSSIFKENLFTLSEYCQTLYHVMRDDYSSLSGKSWNSSVSNLNFSPLHFAAYRNESSALKLALENSQDVKLSMDKFNRSPLFYSIINKHQGITDLILNYLISLSKTKEHNLYIESYNATKNDLPMIIENSPLEICEFLNKCIYSSNAPPQVGVAIAKFKFCDSIIPLVADFIAQEGGEKEPLKLIYSVFDLPSKGSRPSIDLLTSFVNSTNKDIFKIILVKTFIKCRWDNLKWMINLYTALLWLNLLLLIALFYDKEVSLYFLIPFIVVNSLLLLWEFVQLIQTGVMYFRDLWNILDFIRIVLSITWVVFIFCELNHPLLDWSLIFCSVTRGITGFKAFDITRYYIRLILQSLSSIGPFLLIFIYTILSFGLLGIAASSTQLSFSSMWITPFGLTFGDSENMKSDGLGLQYITFIIAVFLNVILMMNMIISILGDAFDEFQIYAQVYDSKEMAQSILEMEQIISLFNSQESSRMFLHICQNYYESFDNSWQGKILDARTFIQNIAEQIQLKLTDGYQKTYKDMGILGEQILLVENNIAGSIEESGNKLSRIMNESSSQIKSNVKIIQDKIEMNRGEAENEYGKTLNSIEVSVCGLKEEIYSLERKIQENSSGVEDKLKNAIQLISTLDNKFDEKMDAIESFGDKLLRIESNFNEKLEGFGREIQEKFTKIEKICEKNFEEKIASMDSKMASMESKIDILVQMISNR